MSDQLPIPHDNGRHPVICLHERDWPEVLANVQRIPHIEKRQNSMRIRAVRQDNTMTKFGEDLSDFREEFRQLRESLSAKALMGNLGQILSIIMTVITLWLIATGKR